MARLFVAVWPPEPVVAELRSLPRHEQQGVRFVPQQNWHITLRFIGEADPDEVVAALDSGMFAAATAHLGPAVAVLSGRALVVPVRGLDALAMSVRDVTAHIGDTPGPSFVGHLTLARLKPRAAKPTTLGTPVTGAFDVDEIALVRSNLDPAGARYETVATWPLR